MDERDEARRIGGQLRRLREAAGLSREQAAPLAGRTASTIWNWEHGHLPSVVVLVGYLSRLDASLCDLEPARDVTRGQVLARLREVEAFLREHPE